MAKPHGTDNRGNLVNLIGQPMDVRPSPLPGIHVTTLEEVSAMTKATAAGVYVLNGNRFRINAGDELPEGAEMDAPQERAKGPAPENRMEPQAPENRSAKPEKKG